VTLRLLLGVLAGTLCYLDRTAGFQTMIHRPLVAGTLSGWIFGDFAAGAQAGALLELIHIARLPVGASIPPDDTGAALFCGAAVASAGGGGGQAVPAPVLAGALLLSLLVSELGREADRGVRRLNGRVARAAIEAVEQGDVAAVEHGLYAGVTLFALSGALVSMAALVLGLAAGMYVLPELAGGRGAPLGAMLPVLASMGAAAALSCGRDERSVPAFYLAMTASFALVAVEGWRL
jgi:PTS system mannose-specific IIC component